MAYQLSTIVSKVQRRIRDTGYSSSEITDYINDTQNDVFNEYKLPFMQATQNYATVANVSDLTDGSGLPTNYVQALEVTNSSNKTLTYFDVRELDNLNTNSETNPSGWYFFADTIYLYPTPTSVQTLTLKYYKRPTELTADASVPEIPAEFEELLVVGAAYRVMQVKDNYDQAGVLQAKYDEILQKLVMKYSRPQVGKPSNMRINRRALGKTSY